MSKKNEIVGWIYGCKFNNEKETSYIGSSYAKSFDSVKSGIKNRFKDDTLTKLIVLDVFYSDDDNWTKILVARKHKDEQLIKYNPVLNDLIGTVDHEDELETKKFKLIQRLRAGREKKNLK